jgi:hypothetical protein
MSNITEFYKRDSEGLAELFKIGTQLEADSPEDLGESLEQLLSLSIDSALSQLPGDLASKLRQEARKLRAFTAAQEAGILSLGELFQHRAPPMAALTLAKQLGKELCRHPNCAWPRKVGEVLYYASYASGLVRLGKAVGNLSRENLREAFRQVSARSWVGEPLRSLFRQAARLQA